MLSVLVTLRALPGWRKIGGETVCCFIDRAYWSGCTAVGCCTMMSNTTMILSVVELLIVPYSSYEVAYLIPGRLLIEPTSTTVLTVLSVVPTYGTNP